MDDFDQGTFEEGGASFEGQFQEPVADGGFQTFAPVAEAPAPAAAAAAPAAAPAAAAPLSFGGDDVSPLVEFNKKFRALNDQKDAAEREAKAARRAAGKAGLKALLADRSKVVASRKSKNREDEAAKEREMLDAMSGEPWSRVYALVDVNAAPAGGAGAAAAAADAEAGGGHKKKADKAAAEGGDLGRMKDVLISVKSAPPPVAPGVSGV